jgi:hypothetical protein
MPEGPRGTFPQTWSSPPVTVMWNHMWTHQDVTLAAVKLNSTVSCPRPDSTSGCCPLADSTHVSCPHTGSTLPSLVLRRLTTLGLLSPGKLNPSVSCPTSGSHDWLHCLALAPRCLLDRSTRESWYDGPSPITRVDPDSQNNGRPSLSLTG